MTDAQIFQILGVVYLAVGIGIAINPGFYRQLLKVFSENPPAVYLSGLGALVVGYFIVTYHNVWTGDWTTLITFLGWVALIKGVLLVLLPNVAIKSCVYFEQQMSKYISAWGVFIAIVGGLLTWLGYFGM